MDGLKQTQIKANPLLKDALDAEAKLKDNSFEKFFSDHQYSMGPLPKDSRVFIILLFYPRQLKHCLQSIVGF